jgi:hypothetical protein
VQHNRFNFGGEFTEYFLPSAERGNSKTNKVGQEALFHLKMENVLGFGLSNSLALKCVN